MFSFLTADFSYHWPWLLLQKAWRSLKKLKEAWRSFESLATTGYSCRGWFELRRLIRDLQLIDYSSMPPNTIHSEVASSSQPKQNSWKKESSKPKIKSTQPCKCHLTTCNIPISDYSFVQPNHLFHGSFLVVNIAFPAHLYHNVESVHHYQGGIPPILQQKLRHIRNPSTICKH